MSQLTDEIGKICSLCREASLPPDLTARVEDLVIEISRIEADISARVHIEQILRYLDWVINLPWNTRTQDRLDLIQAKAILNRNHYGLTPVKERILEYLAVLKLNKDAWERSSSTAPDSASDQTIATNGDLSHAILARRAPILCLVGLAGTGKTTLAKSIAEAMNRRFVRIPFGGMSSALDLKGQSRVRPDAEIGLILKGLRFAGSKNPVILLDEIDRIAETARGDIMGVLVELLDPEQNARFTDHYLDYPFDLSEVLFIATANNTTHVATAVMDRLEPIEMPSYTDEEKISIGKNYVFPALLRSSGLSPSNLVIADSVWPIIVRPMGYDSGIRSLERTINSVCRKIAKMIVDGKGTAFTVTPENIREFIDAY
jgi:ATP-dependent Lon protease